MVTKLPHYTLPAFPFLVLLLARRFARRTEWIDARLPAKLSAAFGIIRPCSRSFLCRSR